MTSSCDVDENLEKCSKCFEIASKEGACFVFFPECFAFIGSSFEDTRKCAEKLHSEKGLFSKYRELAIKNKMWASFGGFHEKSENDDGVYNSHVIVDSEGEIVSVYRKTHLFRVDIEGGPHLDETLSILPGDSIEKPVRFLDGFNFGLSTCYDLRFPDFYVSLRKMGANILLVPSAFTVPTGRDHWETLLRARAIENQCYVIAAAQIGFHNPSRTSYGRSMVIDPWGTVILCSPDTPSPHVSFAQIHLDRINKIRRELPVFSHRREDIYCTSL